MTPAQPSDPPRRHLDLPGGRLAYTDEGAGPPVVAIHGLPGGVRDWRWLAPALDGVRLLRVELPGFGESERRLSPPRVEALAEVVAALCASLALPPVTALGHSFGAAVAVALAARHPAAVARLALLAPVGLRPHRSYRQVPALPLLCAALALPGGAALLGPRLQRAFVAAGFPRSTSAAEAVRSIEIVGRHSFAAHRRRVEGLALPTLVAWTEDDALVEAAIAAELAAALPAGPRLCLPGGGHNVQKTCAVEVGAALVSFAQGPPTAAG